MKKILSYYLKPYYSRMCVGFMVKFIGTLMDLALPWVLSHMIDVVIPQNEKNRIFLWGGVMFLCALCAWLFNIIANRMASRIAADTTQAVRDDLFRKVMYLSEPEVDQLTKPSLISRLTTDTYNIHNMIGRMQRLGVRAPILLIGGVAITMTLDPVLSGVLVIDLVLLSFITVFISRKSIPLFTSLQKSVDQFVLVMREDIAGIRVIKALFKNQYEKERFNRINKEVVEKERYATTVMAAVSPLTNLLLNCGLVVVVILGAYRVYSGATRVGAILAFLTYFTVILNAMLSLSKMITILSKSVASAERISAVLDQEEKTPHGMETQQGDENHLEFSHVSFSYDKVANNLDDISFSLKRGEMLGIIGETGSGKSTIVNLLLRLYDVDQGVIRIDGQDIRTMDKKELRRKFGVVFQNDMIFENTIEENIRLDRELDSGQIEAALEDAQAADFVREKSEGAESQLNIKGANLSGGQKQRILIARALAAHPDILILDDSSSALDYKTDAALRQGLKEHYENTTLVIIAQRISSIMGSDHILVLEDGKAIGYGTHEDLLKACEVYREIGRSQMGMGEENGGETLCR